MCSEGEGVEKKEISKREYLYFRLFVRTVCASLTSCDMLEEGQSGQGQVVRVSARLAHKEPAAFSIPLSSGSPSQRTCKQPLCSSTHFISPPLYEAAAFPRPSAALCCCPPRGGHLWSWRASKRSVRERALKGACAGAASGRETHQPVYTRPFQAYWVFFLFFFFFTCTRCAHMQMIQELWCFARVQTVSVCLLMSSHALTNGPSDLITCIHHCCTSFFFIFIPK